MEQSFIMNYHHHTTTILPLRPFFQDHSGDPVTEENLVQGKINRGRHTNHPDGHHSIVTSAHLHHSPNELTTEQIISSQLNNKNHRLPLLLHQFNGLFSRTTWVSWHEKGKPFWILLEQEMGWQWHQLDHMQIICTLLQTDNHASTSSLQFLQARCPSCCPTNSVKALKANINQTLTAHQSKSIPSFVAS